MGSAQGPHLTELTDAWLVGSSNHLLQSPPVQGRAHTMAVCNVFSQDAFYCSSVKVNKNLAQEFCFPKFLGSFLYQSGDIRRL